MAAPADLLRRALAGSLPADGRAGALAGLVRRPEPGGTSVVAARAEGSVDISRHFPTVRDLYETPDLAAAPRAAGGEAIGGF